MNILLNGWIWAKSEKERIHLESLGIIMLGKCVDKVSILRQTPLGVIFEDCEVSMKALEALSEYWGRYYWGLFAGLQIR